MLTRLNDAQEAEVIISIDSKLICRLGSLKAKVISQKLTINDGGKRCQANRPNRPFNKISPQDILFPKLGRKRLR